MTELKLTGKENYLAEAFRYFLEEGMHADKAINEVFKKNRISDELMRETIYSYFYDIIRFWRPLSTALRKDDLISKDDAWQFMKACDFWKKACRDKTALTAGNSAEEKLLKYASLPEIRRSMPEWLDKEGVKQLGEEKWDTLIAALNRFPETDIRVNSLKTDADQLMQSLNNEHVYGRTIDGLENGIEITKGKGVVFRTDAYHNGWFSVQDRASQKVVAALDVRPGMKVIDACAGSGGKSIQLAALMKNKGKIVAMDVVPKKLDELRKRCAKSGVDVVETFIANEKNISALHEYADRLLIDAPCSGTGVLRRNPDIRWRLHPDDLSELHMMQKNILNKYADMLKPSGIMVYATCSVLPSEGEEQIRQFLETHSNWILEEETRTSPEKNEGDGFYFARLKKIQQA
ncbi:MAG: class I SAM-dependent methyltransferase [Bacteroidia bacterium]